VKTPSPGRVFLVLILFLGLIGSASAASSKVSTVANSDGTFTIVAKATNGFNRDVESLKSDAQEAAEQYCAAHGKKLKLISNKIEKPFFGTGYVKAVLVFKALDANDPAMNSEVAVTADGRHVLVPLNSPPAAAMASAPAPVAVAPPPPPTTTDTYNDLLKLDDLRKRGILTEEEFQTEKKKVLARTQ
jgi:hypothetical protein